MSQATPMEVKFAPQIVRAQLRRILACESFVRSRRMQRFLEFIVEEKLAGRAAQLCEYGIGTAVFDRGQDFEPALDPIVRNDARRLRLKLLEYYRHWQPRPADELVIDIPKGGYVPVFLPLPASAERSAASARRVAVLPFEVLSTAPQDASYGRALCLSLTASLTGMEGLEAIAHGYLQGLPMRDAARELRLTHAIHGSVLRVSDWCHVTVHLIHIPNGTQLWAQEYDFEDRELLTFQSEITRSLRREVAELLGLPPLQSQRLALAA